MIMDRMGIGGSFAEFHPVDFTDGFVLVGHDGPHNISIAEGKPVLRSLKKYHGKPGNGAGVEFKIKEGPTTLLFYQIPPTMENLNSSSQKENPLAVPYLLPAIRTQEDSFNPMYGHS